jgi:hypothetical protein
MSTAAATNKDSSMFKWACLLVAVVALTAYGWMLNDLRLEVKALSPKVEKLIDKSEDVAAKVDKHLPRLLAETEQAGKTINTNLPPLVKRSEAFLDQSASTEESLIDLTDSFRQYRDLMGGAQGGKQDKPMLAYGTSLLKFIGEQNASIGVKKRGPEQAVRQAVPARQWASTAQRDLYFLSLVAKTKEDMLHGLARTRSPAPLQILLQDQGPRLLGDFLRDLHPESKGVN